VAIWRRGCLPEAPERPLPKAAAGAQLQLADGRRLHRLHILSREASVKKQRVTRLSIPTKLTSLLIGCLVAGMGWAKVHRELEAGASAVLRATGHLARTGKTAAGPVWRVPTEQKVVALTFDDGPNPVYTPQVLKLAREKGIKVTFFLIGRNIQLYPELAREEAAEGHALGNHTWDHHEMPQLSRRQDMSEIERCEDEIERICGQRPHLFRPPKGAMNGNTLAAAATLGYRVVLWSVALEHHPSRTPEEMAQRVVRMARPGMIILAHDGAPPVDRSKTLRALPILVDGLQRKGYRFVTVPELLAMGDAKRS